MRPRYVPPPKPYNPEGAMELLAEVKRRLDLFLGGHWANPVQMERLLTLLEQAEQMLTPPEEREMNISRRDFLKLAGGTAAAVALGIPNVAESPATPVFYYGPITPNGGDIIYTHEDGTETIWWAVSGFPVWLVEWSDGTVTMQQDRD